MIETKRINKFKLELIKKLPYFPHKNTQKKLNETTLLSASLPQLWRISMKMVQ